MQHHVEQPPGAAGVFPIWPGSGTPPGAEDWSWHEQTMPAPEPLFPSLMVRNVVIHAQQAEERAEEALDLSER